ncbi:MAG: MFS transporter [Holophagales bacterium]|nr:MFS transporter [Holophagales bacterium]
MADPPPQQSPSEAPESPPGSEAGTSSEPAEVKSRRGSLASLFAIVIVDLVGFGVVIPILPFYAESFGASATVLGLLLTCYAAMQFFFAPVWGRWSDRVGRRPVMLLTIAGTAVALLVMGLASSLAWLFAARLLGGLFGANISVASAYITDVTSEEERTRFMGFLGASFGLGFILGPAIGGLLAPYGYNVPMFFAAGLAAVNFLVALRYLREPERSPVTTAPMPGPEQLRRLPGGRVLVLCVAYFIFVFGVSQLETVFAFFMLDRFGWDAHQVAFILVFMGVITAGIQGGAIRPLAKALVEKRLLILGSLLLAPSLAVVPACHGIVILLVPLALSSVGRGLVHPALLSLVSSAAGAHERGQVMGTFQSSASLARMAGPLVAGLLYDSRLAYPFWLAGVLMLVVLAIGFGLGSAGSSE